MQKIEKNRKKLTAFFASFLLHFLLFASFFNFDLKSETQPEVALEIELITPGEAKKSAKVRLKKNTHEPSDHVHLAEESNSQGESQIDPIFHPLPEIPKDLRDEAFSSRALARFHIGENGEVAKVELIQPCPNPRLNVLLLKSLQKWKFPSESSGKTQDISVTFLVR